MEELARSFMIHDNRKRVKRAFYIFTFAVIEIDYLD